MKNHFPAKFAESKFHCPHCGVFAMQLWGNLSVTKNLYDRSINTMTRFTEELSFKWKISKCDFCSQYIIWLNENIIYPDKDNIDPPNVDLDEDIQSDYLEAASILEKSPRGAAALLRLCLQKLLKQLGENGSRINDDITSLIQKGLNTTVQSALDYVRVTGNNAVHPGVIDLKDNKDIAIKLFRVINFIANKMISEPKEIQELYDALPESEKDKIDKRNKKIIE